MGRMNACAVKGEESRGVAAEEREKSKEGCNPEEEGFSSEAPGC